MTRDETEMAEFARLLATKRGYAAHETGVRSCRPLGAETNRLARQALGGAVATPASPERVPRRGVPADEQALTRRLLATVDDLAPGDAADLATRAPYAAFERAVGRLNAMRAAGKRIFNAGGFLHRVATAVEGGP